MKLNTEQLQEIKQELKKFSSAPILKSYKLIAQIYKSEIDTQTLIDSQITKCFVRIGSKKYTEDDEEKYAKAIKICRKLVKQWKQVIVTDGETQQEERKVQKQKIVEKQSTDEPKIQKKIKPEANKKEDNKNGHKITTQPEEAVEEGKREKAVEALKKYFKQQTQDEQLEWVVKIEQTIFDLYNNQVQIYMEKVKGIVKQIDRNGEFRTKLLRGEFDLVSEVKKLK